MEQRRDAQFLLLHGWREKVSAVCHEGHESLSVLQMESYELVAQINRASLYFVFPLWSFINYCTLPYPYVQVLLTGRKMRKSHMLLVLIGFCGHFSTIILLFILFDSVVRETETGQITYCKETKIAWLSFMVSGAAIDPTITSYRKYQWPWWHWTLKRTDYLQNGILHWQQLY